MTESTHAVSVTGQGESGNNAEGDDGAVEPSAPSHGSGRAVTTDEEQLLNLQSNFLHDHDADSQNNGVRSPVSPKNGHRCGTPREEGEEEQCRPLLSEEVNAYFGKGANDIIRLAFRSTARTSGPTCG